VVAVSSELGWNIKLSLLLLLSLAVLGTFRALFEMGKKAILLFIKNNL
jgi:hypothetical protein